jgi:hypothetical protein
MPLTESANNGLTLKKAVECSNLNSNFKHFNFTPNVYVIDRVKEELFHQQK